MPALLLAALLAATPDDCREAYAAVNYREAATACLAVLSTASIAELPGLYRLAALSHAAIGDDEQAFRLFVSLLSMDPATQLDAALSPKLRAPFERARSAQGGKAIQLQANAHAAREGEPLRLEVGIEDGPQHPATTLRARGPGIDLKIARMNPTVVPLEPAPPGTFLIQLQALDRFGGPLASSAWEWVVEPRLKPRSAALSWKLWGIISGVVLAGAIGSGVGSRLTFAAATSQRFASDAATSLELSRGAAIGADVGFAVGGAVGLGALILLLTSGRE